MDHSHHLRHLFYPPSVGGYRLVCVSGERYLNPTTGDVLSALAILLIPMPRISQKGASVVTLRFSSLSYIPDAARIYIEQSPRQP